MIDIGQGYPIVFVPGIQGRWEWMTLAIREIAKRCRVLTFSYDRTPESRRRATPPTTLDSLVDQLREVMDTAGVHRAAICGVSFGGFVAARFAACHPDRVSALILVSSPTPRWRPDERLLRYMQRPLLSMPLVLPAWFLRMWPEIFAAQPTLAGRARFAARYLGRIISSPLSVTKMAGWAKLKMATDIEADCGRIAAPSLLVTGEPALDRVVDIQRSQDWLTLVPGMRHVTMERTGHIGLVTKPELFADIVCGFVEENTRAR